MALTCCVYIVEDDEPVARSLADLLQLSGYTVLRFASADLFLGRVHELPFGCIIMDYAMPGTNGLGALRELSRRGLRWPVLVMTGHERAEIEEEALRWGARLLVEKPFDADMLIAELEALACRVPPPRLRHPGQTRPGPRSQASEGAGRLSPRSRTMPTLLKRRRDSRV